LPALAFLRALALLCPLARPLGWLFPFPRAVPAGLALFYARPLGWLSLFPRAVPAGLALFYARPLGWLSTKNK